MLFLKEDTAATVKIGPFLDSEDGDTVEDALSIAQADVRLSKNGGDIAQKNDATSCTHDELGIYDCPLNATDTSTAGRLQLFVHKSGALSVWHEFIVLPQQVYDSLVGGTDALQVHTNELSNDIITAGTIATGAITNAKIANDTINANKIADGTIDAATFAASAITAAAIAANAINAAAISAGAIDSDAIAPSAAQEIADAVWDEQSSGHIDAGKAGQQLWTDIDDILTDTGTSGVAVADGAITSTTIATGAIDADAIAANAIGASEIADGAVDAGAIAAGAANKIADHTIRRTFQNACDSSDGDTKTFRSLLGAIAKLVNKVSVSGSTLTIHEDDDTTSLGTQTITTNAAADPITELDTT